MQFAVVGGDERMICLAELLAADGHAVRVYGTERGETPPGVRRADTLEEACGGADCVALPLPATDGRGTLTAPMSRSPIPVTRVMDAVEPGTAVLAGRITPDAALAAQAAGLQPVDYFLREELTVANAALTAEGAAQVLLEATRDAVAGMAVLVVGFGRVGKLTAHRLAALGARVTVSARRPSDLAWIRAYGYGDAETGALEPLLHTFGAVVNTVPACVLGAERLRLLRRDCVVLELASAPGGLDRKAAEALELRVVAAPGLPGRVAPLAAGRAIRDAMYGILREEGRL